MPPLTRAWPPASRRERLGSAHHRAGRRAGICNTLGVPRGAGCFGGPLTQQEQYIACLQILYPRWKELPDANAALRAAFTFINEGKEDEQQGFRPRLVDWEQDAALIAPAVDKVLGYSCRRCGYLHWWEFLGAFHGIGDGLFAQVASIRNKRAHGKMLDKSEQEFARENAAIIKIHAAESAEDKAEKERLLDLLGR